MRILLDWKGIAAFEYWPSSIFHPSFILAIIFYPLILDTDKNDLGKRDNEWGIKSYAINCGWHYTFRFNQL